jgi:hypothetical protein
MGRAHRDWISRLGGPALDSIVEASSGAILLLAPAC